MATDVKALLRPDETMLDVYFRTRAQRLRCGVPTLDHEVDPRFRLVSGSLVELYGLSGTGKSRTLLRMAIDFALPPSLGGPGGQVHILDLDGRLAVATLDEIGRQRVHAAVSEDVDLVDAERVVEDVLGSVFLHRCSGPLQLLAALTAIHHGPASTAPRMIALESLGSLGLASRGQPDASVHWVHALRRLLRSPVPTCAVAVKPAYFLGDRASPSSHAHREYMPRAWQHCVTHRMTFHRPTHAAPPEVCAGPGAGEEERAMGAEALVLGIALDCALVTTFAVRGGSHWRDPRTIVLDFDDVAMELLPASG